MLEQQETPVFTYLCSEIGETRDVNRFDIEQNDLEMASDLYNMFKGAKGKFKTNDKRCKLFDIGVFHSSNEWSVDRWWTKEEKIELGIEDESTVISLDNFIGMIDEVSSSMLEVEEPLKELNSDVDDAVCEKVTLSEIFDFTITTNSSNFTKTFINANKGDIPVYGASKNEEDVSYGYVQDDLSNVKYFSDCLTWNIDGSIGLFYRKGKFSLSEKVIPLMLKDKYLNKFDMEFLKYVILAEVQKNPFSYTNKGGKGRLGKIVIDVPVNENGEFCVETQKKIANKYRVVEQYKIEIKSKLEMLIQQQVEL